MLSAAALVCVCAVAWCSQAAAAAAAGGRPDSGNFLDDKQWLTTISQYDKEVGQWNKFRDEVEDDYFRTWSPGKPFDQALDPAKDPCLKMKCSRHKVCVAQDQQTAVCISHRRLTHSMKEAGLGHKQWRGGPISSNCKQCPVVYTNPVCGSDGHTYSSQLLQPVSSFILPGIKREVKRTWSALQMGCFVEANHLLPFFYPEMQLSAVQHTL